MPTQKLVFKFFGWILIFFFNNFVNYLLYILNVLNTNFYCFICEISILYNIAWFYDVLKFDTNMFLNKKQCKCVLFFFKLNLSTYQPNLSNLTIKLSKLERSTYQFTNYQLINLSTIKTSNHQIILIYITYKYVLW